MAKKKAPAPEVIVEDIIPSTLDDLMGERFDIYAKDVIQDRAIPDARDGLKPVQRRIIYAMFKTGNTIDKPTKKCAHIVGEVMGKYHPHGDSSIYEALVRMSQPWRLRVPLINFQGNNGSMDGDGAAAYRYTEARLAAISQELVRDLEKDVIDMGLTFDDTEFEPTVLPGRFPNLFVNGSSGIAVGLATEIPPHNLREIIKAITYRIKHPNCPIETLMSFVPGPDFPTGGIIYESQGLSDIYLTGRGHIDIRSKVAIEEDEKTHTSQIIVTEIPYNVTKSALVFEIDKIRHDKTIAGIEEVRDETDKTGLRIAIDIKEGFKAESILAYLMQKTRLRSSYNANMIAIVNNRPQTLNLLSYCDTYIAHQREVITRRSVFDLGKSKTRLEIVEGLIKASDLIDRIVHIIRHSNDKADSKANIIKEFGFTELQSEAIVMMPLYKLSHFDVQVVLDEKKRLDDEIAKLKAILSNPDLLDDLIVEDLKEIAKKYGDDRRTVIEEGDAASLSQINARDLVAKETVRITVTRDGYVKRSSIASWRSSGGQTGAMPGKKDGDTIIYNGECESTDTLLVFTSKGSYLYLPVHQIKATKWLEEGQHVNSLINLPPEEKIIRAFAIRKFREDLYAVMVSRNGQIKRTKLSAFPVTRFNRPIRAMRILLNDQLVSVCITSGNDNLFLASNTGLGIFYNENEIAPSSTNSAGIKAASFKGGDVADMLSFNPEEKGKVVIITNRAHTRVFGMGNIELTGRLNKATVLFKTFKSDPHDVLFLDKVLDREAPLKYTAICKDGSELNIEVPDLYLTPMDKYAKSSVKMHKDVVIATMTRMDSVLITKETKSFAPEKVVEEIPNPSTESEETAESVAEAEKTETMGVSERIERPEDDRPVEKYEQISIFGDDDFDM